MLSTQPPGRNYPGSVKFNSGEEIHVVIQVSVLPALWGGGVHAVDRARIPQEVMKRLPGVRLAVAGDRFR